MIPSVFKVISLARLPLYGSTWNDKGIKGIDLVKFLSKNNIHNIFRHFNGRCIKCVKGGLHKRVDIVLWTENNTQIRWGCSSYVMNPTNSQ